MIDPAAARWFRDRRGIEQATLESFGVRSGEGEPDLTIFPYPGGLQKFRKGWEKSDGRKFWWEDAQGNRATPGQAPFLPPDFDPDAPHYLLFEGETDTMAAWQHAPEEWKSRLIGLSGANAWKPEYAESYFGKARYVLVVTDQDDPYENPQAAKQVEDSWAKIRHDLGRKARRVRLPPGIGDVAEFFQMHEWAAFQVLLRKAAEPVRHYKRLDLSQPVPKTDWLVEDLLVSGEVTVLAGDSGLGKSFITQALALAIAGDDKAFLDLAIKKHGPVLYVDEENSAQLILSRLNALGMSEKHHKRIEYLNYAGVRLDAEPHLLLEEALDIQPVLVVIDSQSRVALDTEENSNTEVTRLFQRGFVPIARETGAAVVVLHHTPKDKRGPRGAGAIKAAADQAIEIVQALDQNDNPTGNLNLFPSKPRRLTAHLSARITGDVEKDGWVRVERVPEWKSPV